MNRPGVGDSDLLVRARSALLDALVALEPHRESVVVIGAQAIYLRTSGEWLNADGIPVDLMVPERLAGVGNNSSRGARIPPHHEHATRRARGLEAAIVDNDSIALQTSILASDLLRALGG